MEETERQSTHFAHARLVAWTLALVAAIAIAVSGASMLVQVDLAIARAVHGHTVGWLTAVVSGVGDLGSTDVVMAMTALAVLALVVLRHWRGAIALALAVLSTQAAVALIKALVGRPRPDTGLALVDPAGYSFPSAHSASAVALYMTLALIAAGLWRRSFRMVAFSAAALVVLLVGLSRVYLGAHYSTDVVAGWLVGGAMVAASWAISHRIAAPSPGRVAHQAVPR
jgi:membrane-associated phospholipid phosphatase